MVNFERIFAVIGAVLLTASASMAASVPAPDVDEVRSILADLSDRNVRLNSSFLDPGDVGHAYVFTEAVDLAIIGSGSNNSRSELLGFARTGDRRNGGAANPFVDDGEAGNRIDLFIDDLGNLTDDLTSLLAGLGSDWLSNAVVAPGEFLAFNVLGTRSRAPIDTVVFTGGFYSALYPGLPGGGTNTAPVPLPAGVLLLLSGLGSLLFVFRRRHA